MILIKNFGSKRTEYHMNLIVSQSMLSSKIIDNIKIGGGDL